jgi:hypothetical protein
MKRLVVLGGVIAALSVSSAAVAAEASLAQLGAVSGQVLVNKGDGFKVATPGTTLRAGDRVIVRGKGKAGLKYADGCSVALVAGSMATINGVTPCKAGGKAAGLIGAPSLGTTVDPFAFRDINSPFKGWTALDTVFTAGFIGGTAAGIGGAFEDDKGRQLPSSP